MCCLLALHLVSYMGHVGASSKFEDCPPTPTPCTVTTMPVHTVLPAGTRDAAKALRGARWAGISRGGSASISNTYLKVVDVILVDTSSFQDMVFVKGAAGWTKKGLLDRGFLSVSRPTVVLCKDTSHILALFLTGEEVTGLCNLTLKFPELHKSLVGPMNPIRKRPKLCMLGYRWNRWKYHLTFQTGYHCTKTLKQAIQLWRNKAALGLVVDVATEMCATERDVSPAMAHHRSLHAEDSAHPGILPGVSTVSCPAQALGISQAYVSDVHSDASAKGMVEMIVWNASGLTRAADYCFAIVDAGIVFDLTPQCGAAMCMVQGSVRHGTPGLATGFRGVHRGFGAVVINKQNILTDDARVGTKRIRDRTTNPFVQSFAQEKRHCHLCSSARIETLESCEECNKSFHPRCAPVVRSCQVNMKLCTACLPLVEAVQERPWPESLQLPSPVGVVQRWILRICNSINWLFGM